MKPEAGAYEASQLSGQSHETRGLVRALAAKVLAIAVLTVGVSVAREASADAAVSKKISSSPSEEVINNSATYWAGYEATSPANLNEIVTDFIVPSVSCSPTGESDVSIWAGVGQGTSTDPLYQTGIRLECDDGTESSHVWWEEYPNNSEQDYSSRTVSAGDKIVAYVEPATGSGVVLGIQDYGSNLSNPYSNWFSQHTIGGDATPSTSECIVEQPESGGSPVDLADFGTIDFSTATSGSFNSACDVVANDRDHIISSSQSTLNHGVTGTALTIEDSSAVVLADTSSASSTGEFDVTWYAAN